MFSKKKPRKCAKAKEKKNKTSTLKHIKRNYVLDLNFPRQVFVNYKKLY